LWRSEHLVSTNGRYFGGNGKTSEVKLKKLNFNKLNNLSALHDEIIVALPSLASVADANGDLSAVINVEELDSEIWITVPDNTDEAAIAAVVQGHAGAISQLDPSAERQARIAELLAIPRSEWVAAQQRQLLPIAAQELA